MFQPIDNHYHQNFLAINTQRAQLMPTPKPVHQQPRQSLEMPEKHVNREIPDPNFSSVRDLGSFFGMIHNVKKYQRQENLAKEQPLDQPLDLSIPSQPMPGFVRNSTPNLSMSSLLGSRSPSPSPEQGIKRRRRNQLYGDVEIERVQIEFADCPEKAAFCDSEGHFKRPSIPDCEADKHSLIQDLLALFSNSNLPEVPGHLKEHLVLLSFYPDMFHLHHLSNQGIDLNSLTFHQNGFVFINPNIQNAANYGTTTFEDVSNDYPAEDGLFYCKNAAKVGGNGRCNASFTSRSHLHRHLKNHAEQKKYVCSFCRTMMSDLHDIKRHYSTHTDMKPFKCEQCDKAFIQKAPYLKHTSKCRRDM